MKKKRHSPESIMRILRQAESDQSITAVCREHEITEQTLYRFEVFGHNLRHLFGMGTINLSVAVWGGFLALFGIATDNGVIVCTYLQQVFKGRAPQSVEAIHAATVEAGSRRVRPAMMTSATTILALLPVLSSTGRGADVMIPMAIPTFGGMMLAMLTIFVVPVLYCGIAELSLKLKSAAITKDSGST